MLSLLLLFASAQATTTPNPCSGSTTIDMNDCLSGKLDAAEAELARYTAAALVRLRGLAGEAEPSSANAGFPAAFGKAGQAWAAYRDGECDAVYIRWSGGTIRTAMALRCRLVMTKWRTRTIWSNWLTHMDDTPPILPEPKADADE
ncbi:lysozyme inhibitor LprI family protein [uncultured Sphingomonas sp.]|uniref:lysozyme inhibitor LprI family protein n=1 Tax=uncultured Sphingomonas sp. TaxID=158754 RepID=UPI0035CA2AD0